MFRLPRLAIAGSLLALLFSPLLYAQTVDDLTGGQPYYYQAAAGTDVALVMETKGSTDSGINHLPVFHGHMSTNNTYRFVNIAEQVITIIGDGKHGLWRYQDNGSVRLYITDEAEAGAVGVLATDAAAFDLTDPHEAQDFALTLTATDIGVNYTHIDPSALGGGYRSNATIENANGHLAFLDVPIFHDFFAGVYDTHVPIDLAGYYCTMSAPDYAEAAAAMDFAFAQPGASQVGPLGARAGLDISENYTKVLRLHSFPDAKIWANTKSRDAASWHAVNTAKSRAEIYFVEKPFFNRSYLFIVVVLENGSRLSAAGTHASRQSQYSYVRPDGPYHEHLLARAGGGETLPAYNTVLIDSPQIDVVLGGGRLKKRAIDGFRLYGIHHPATGACPSMGGDFGEAYYGAAWPNNYQEVTPLCDGLVIDIKLWANLDGVDWNSRRKNLANNTGSTGLDPADPLVKNYTNSVTSPLLSPGNYGTITDPYLINGGYVNPEAFTASGTDTLTYPSANDQVVSIEN